MAGNGFVSGKGWSKAAGCLNIILDGISVGVRTIVSDPRDCGEMCAMARGAVIGGWGNLGNMDGGSAIGAVGTQGGHGGNVDGSSSSSSSPAA